MAKSRWKKQQERERREAEVKQRFEEESQELASSRRKGGGYDRDGWFTLGRLRFFKIALLIAMPISFFLYSILLLPIVALYGFLYFASRGIERRQNAGLRKELWVKVPKFDTAIALGVVIMITCVVGLSVLSTGTEPSMYAGRSETQIYSMLREDGMSSHQAQERTERIMSSGMHLSPLQRAGLQMLTLQTGQREMFRTVNDFSTQFASGGNVVVRQPQGGGSGGGGTHQIPEAGGNLVIRNPDGSRTQHTGSREELERIAAQHRSSTGNALGNMPLAQSIGQSFRVISMAMLAIVLFGGAILVAKNTKNDETSPKVA